MKTKLILIFVMLTSSLLVGCENQQNNTFEDQSSSTFENVTYPENDMENNVDNMLVDSIQKFSVNNLDVLFEGDDNVCYSPLSLYFGLSMLENGAGNQSMEQIQNALNSADINHNLSMQQLYQTLYTESEQSKFFIANSIWTNDKIDISEGFKKTVSESYFSAINQTDFSEPKKASDIISQWISDNTNSLIKPQITIHPSTIAMIVNAVYLSDLWKFEFDERLTQEDTFYLENTQTTTASFMNMTMYSKDVFESSSATIFSLPLQQLGEMVFVLPNEETLISKHDLSSEVSGYINNQLTSKTVDNLSLKIPKFKIESDLNLIDYLKSIGMKDIFSSNADLTNMTTADAFVSGVHQGCVLEINEYGVEGAAYTSIRADSSTDETLDFYEFHLNRPFFFMLLSNDNIPIFIGKVMMP